MGCGGSGSSSRGGGDSNPAVSSSAKSISSAAGRGLSCIGMALLPSVEGLLNIDSNSIVRGSGSGVCASSCVGGAESCATGRGGSSFRGAGRDACGLPNIPINSSSCEASES